ncbi:MAG TPA: deoxyribodipyrimidine photo-lyase [Dongiaceae bacterium]|nr:deoxyribodipyrimidine photo-lyase [Dongiaceae bacterium]
MTTAVWFRSDLRLQDNPALYAACQHPGPVVAIYLFTPEQFAAHDVGLVRQRFLIENLMCLSRDLAKIGIPLLVERCSRFDDSVLTLVNLCHQHRIIQLHFNEEYELNEQRRDTTAFLALHQSGVSVQRHQDQVLLAPGSVMTGQGSPFRVFTPFKRAWLQLARRDAVQPLPVPRKRAPAPVIPTAAESLEHWVPAQPANAFWPAGSKQALRRLDQFVASRIEQYQAQRDFPLLDGTSQLSPYLAVGALSIRACFHAALNANRFEWDSGNPGIQTWISELIWREFYKHLIFNFPDLCKGRAFQPATEAVRWQRNPTLLLAWQEGRTGFPIVDAAMRQLSSLGWMHNRLRMVTAMFLTKHLFIHWHEGERWFMQHLIDGDFAANNGGWQWSASTGADAAPYFRVFNPTRQSERFDADGGFIRHWLPELKGLTGKQIHDPTPMERQLCGYPQPIVDHRAAVDRIKQEFQSIKGLVLA